MAGGRATGDKFITKSTEYSLVYEKGKSWVSDVVVVRVLANELTLSRYGVSVSKRVGKAVVRNKMKRRLREIMRTLPLRPGWDIVFIVRPAAANTDYAGLKQVVENLLTRADLIAAFSPAV